LIIGNNDTYRSPMPDTDCPPSYAENKDIEVVYRLALNDPPQMDDFYSHIEAGKNYPPGMECVAASVSVFKDEAEALKKKKKIPAYKRHGVIAIGPIHANTGVVVESKTSSHVDWWLYKGQQVHHLFSIK